MSRGAWRASFPTFVKKVGKLIVFGYSDSRMTVPRNRSAQVDATPRSGDPARRKIGHTYSGIALESGP
jgi:hypothetical protein